MGGREGGRRGGQRRRKVSEDGMPGSGWFWGRDDVSVGGAHSLGVFAMS